MISKQEILLQCGDSYFQPEVLQAMDVYAEIKAKDFVLFREQYKLIERVNARIQYRKSSGIFSWVGADDDMIYDAFQNNEQLKRIPSI